MTDDETISEQLAEIDRDMADIERQVAELVEEAQRADYKTQELPEYTPPEGWRVVRFGEHLLPGDVWVNEDGTERRSAILHWDAAAVSGGRCIRRIKREAQPEPQPQPVQVREGRWRTRSGDIRNVTPTPEGDGRKERFPWWDAAYQGTWTSDGRYLFGEASPLDLFEYIGPIEQQPQPEPQPEPHAATIEELRSEVSYVQRLLGESRQRVTQLEELVASLRTINEGAEKAVSGAGVVNDSLRLQLAAVKAELVTQAETSRRLQIELDAAQQVPADSPELRQLRADLAEVTQDRDTYRHAHELLVNDVNATHQRTKVMTIEAIVEWLVPIRTCGSQALATAVISNLPHIMRHLTGLEDEEIE